jgi:transformation/transcription domain-associated protein
MSLLAFLLRNPNDALKSFKQAIPEYVVRLLKDCPPELSAARKELLVATRHVLSTDFRGAFLAKIDILSNEKVLVGAGITSHETLRFDVY